MILLHQVIAHVCFLPELCLFHESLLCWIGIIAWLHEEILTELIKGTGFSISLN